MANAGELLATIALQGMDEVDRQLRRFSDSMNNASDNIKNAGQRMQDVGDSMSQAGQSLAPLSAGLTAMGVAGITASENITKGINIFKTNLGATGKELSALEDSMKNVASTGVGSFEEVSLAMVNVTQNMGKLKGKELESITEQAMQLANVLGEDVQAVTRSAGTLMKQFGVDSTTALDLIAKGYQHNLNFSGEFLDSLNEYSVHFKSLGFTAEDMFNIMINGAQQGAWNLDKIGDAIKEGNIRLKDLSDGSAEAFQALGLDAETLFNDFASGGEKAKMSFMTIMGALSQVESETERNRLGVALFGTQYEDLEKDVVASFGNITNSLGDYAGTAAQVAEDNKTFGQVMAGAWNDLQVALKPVGDIMIQFATTVLPPLLAVIKSIAAAFSALPQPVQFAIIALGALAAIIPVLLIAVGGLISAMGTIVSSFSLVTGGAGGASKGLGVLIGVFKKVGTAFLSMSKLFLTNPFMLIATGVAIVVVLVIKYWDEIVAVTKAVFSALSDWFGTMWDEVKEFIASVVEAAKKAWQEFKEFFETLFKAIVEFVKNVWDSIKKAFESAVQAIQKIIENIKVFFQKVFDGAKAIVENVLKVLRTIFEAYVNAVKTYLETIKNLFSTIWNFISNSIVKPVIETIKNVISSVVSKVSEITSNVKSRFSDAFNSVKSTVSGAVDTVVSKIKGIWNTASDIAGKIKGAFTNLFSGIKIPKFSYSGSLNPLDWATKGMPKIKVQWNAKGGILDNATLIGAGEKGAEAIVPLSSQRRMKPFAQAVSKYMDDSKGGTGEVNINIQQMTVKDEQDIRRISQELYKLIQRDKRAGGNR